MILAAAQDLFSKQIYESISMNTIAARADLAKGTLYLYFRTREEIFLALLTREIRAWLASLGAAVREFSAPKELMTIPQGVDLISILPDGKRILAIRSVGQRSASPQNLVLNWQHLVR